VEWSGQLYCEHLEDIVKSLTPLVIFYLISYILLIALVYVIHIQSAALYIKMVPKIFSMTAEGTSKKLVAEVVTR